MIIENINIEGAFIIKNFNSNDGRGKFVKTYNVTDFNHNNLNFTVKESYYSINKKNVIRGMHFQLPPYNHNKLVYVSTGKIIDVILDLRKNSKTFLKFCEIKLSENDNSSIYIPSGCAHGFISLEDDTTMVYNVDSVYSSDYDSGLRFDSFGYNWKVKNPIISKRDKKLSLLNSFLTNNPF